MKLFRHLLADRTAASAAEFALVLPLFLLLLFGIIDAGRFMWEYNLAEKATQMGVRYAVVTNPVASGLSSYSFSISDGIGQGNAVPTDNFDVATCTDSTCDCTGGAICGSIGHDGAAFANIVARMAAMYPAITPANVEVEYKNVGLGFAGNPDGPDVSALVTVRMRADNPLVFRPITCFVFLCSIDMPSFRAALTLEDASGAVSN